MSEHPMVDHLNEHSGMVFVWLLGMAIVESLGVWLVTKWLTGFDIVSWVLYNTVLR